MNQRPVGFWSNCVGLKIDTCMKLKENCGFFFFFFNKDLEIKSQMWQMLFIYLQYTNTEILHRSY